MPKKAWFLPNENGTFRCLLCGEDVRFASEWAFRRYHRPQVDGAEDTRCQGQIARANGLDIRARPLMVYFGGAPYFGRVVFEDPNLKYKELDDGTRGGAATIWRAQFEDKEEYELTAPELEVAMQNLEAVGAGHEIEVPFDRGEAGFMPGVEDPEHQGDGEEEEEDADEGEPPLDMERDRMDREEESSDDGEGSDLSLEFDSDEDEELEMHPDHEISLEQRMCDKTGVNMFSHIYRTLVDRRKNTTHSSIMETFARENESFGVKLPTSWNQLKRILKVRFCFCPYYFPTDLCVPLRRLTASRVSLLRAGAYPRQLRSAHVHAWALRLAVSSRE